MKAVSAIVIVIVLAASAHAEVPVFVEDKVVPEPPDDGSERFATVGLLTGPTGGWFGLRAQLDAWTFHRLSIGAAGTLFGRAQDVTNASTFKAFGVAYLAFTQPIYRSVQLRAQLGYGGGYEKAQDPTTMMVTSTTSQVLEGSLLVTGRAGHDWSVLAGPIVERATASGDTTVMLFVGLQRRF